MVWVVKVEGRAELDLPKEKNVIVIAKMRQVREKLKRKAHKRGCICGIKKYPRDNLSLTSSGYKIN